MIKPYYETDLGKLYCGTVLNVLKQLPDEYIDCVITSPPYWALRDYGVKGQLGLEPTFQEYIIKLCNIFDEVKRILKKTGTCWVNLGDTYGGIGHSDWSGNKSWNTQKLKTNKDFKLDKKYPSKCLCQIPSRFSIEMCNRGWILRNKIIWEKSNCMPCGANDRFTVDYEPVFFFVKNKKYWFEQQYEPQILMGQYSINSVKYGKEGRNKRCIWKIPTQPFSDAHFATFPEKLVKTPLLAGCPEKGIVIDPFFGSGTVGLVAEKYNRQWIGIDLNKEYCEIAKDRIKAEVSQLKMRL
jgi:site-specific DNA-methyltransferase (adenine-specific)